jgi:ribosomal protein L7/L12
MSLLRTVLALEAQVAELQRNVAHLYAHAGLSPPPDPAEAPPSPVVAELVAEGKMIEAITQYREETGKGLADAKSAIDELATRYG